MQAKRIAGPQKSPKKVSVPTGPDHPGRRTKAQVISSRGSRRAGKMPLGRKMVPVHLFAGGIRSQPQGRYDAIMEKIHEKRKLERRPQTEEE